MAGNSTFQSVSNVLDDGRQQHVGAALERADVDSSGGAGEEPFDGIPGGVDPGDDVPGVAEDDLAQRGQLHGTRAARAVEQRAADESLEGGDLLADGGLGVAEPSRCSPERAFAGHGVEGDQVAELEIAELAHVHQRS